MKKFEKIIKTVLSSLMVLILLLSLCITANVPANAADVEIKATDSKIRYTGHWVKDGDNMKGYFQSTMEVRFTGTSLKVKCNRALAVKIDDGVYEIVDPVNDVVDAASGLKEGDHKATLIISVPISASNGPTNTIISGFVIDDGAKLLEPDSSKHIAFIGDSITMGHYGASSNWPAGAGYRDSIAKNYVTKAAELLDMVPNATAIGGHGIEKANREDIDTIGMAERYFRQGGMYSDAGEKPFDTSLYAPEYVVVALGTNGSYSYSSAMTAQVVYENMLENLRNAYPNAKIFCVTPFQSTGLSSISLKKDEIIKESVRCRNMDGDNNVYFIDATNFITNPAQVLEYPAGQTLDTVHPTFDGHTLIAEKLVKEMRAALNGDNKQESSSSSKKQYGNKISSKVIGTSSKNDDAAESKVADTTSKKGNKKDKVNSKVVSENKKDEVVDNEIIVDEIIVEEEEQNSGIMDYLWILIVVAAVVVAALLVVIFLPQIKSLFKK